MIRIALRPAALALVTLFASATANATAFTVKAFDNSSTGGTGLATISLLAGLAAVGFVARRRSA